MDGREFLKAIGLGATALTMSGCASGTQRLGGNTYVQQRSNIVFLMSDDQRWDAMGCMGNSVIKTPNMDSLAAEGVLFENAFLTTSICMASRASVMLGQFESRHRCNFEQRPMVEELFDIQNDPIEAYNLIEKPEYSDVLVRLRKLCDDWIRKAK